MTQPTYPLIMIYKNSLLKIMTTEADLCKPLPFGSIRPSDKEVAFDSNGNKWTYQLTSNESNQVENFDQVKASLSKRLLYYMLPSPVLIVKPEWTKLGNYQLGELKQEIAQCIGNCHDVITPLADVDSIETAISQANSFKELYKNLIKYGFDVNENKLWRQQEHKK